MTAGQGPVRVLITGGCGFIGVNLVDHLLEHGIYEIRVLDSLGTVPDEHLREVAARRSVVLKVASTLDRPDLTGASSAREARTIELMVGDVRDWEACVAATTGVHSVVHLAAQAGVVPSIADPYLDFEVNVQGTLNLLHAASRNKVERFILASSNAALGSQTPPLNEQRAPRPSSPYGASKLACEGYCSAFHHSYGLKTVVLRFSNVYGPWSLHKNSVIAKFLKNSALDEALTIYGDGMQTRDFIHVQDVCRAIGRVLTVDAVGVWGETLQLGSGVETRIVALAEAIRQLSGGRTEIVFAAERRGEVRRNYSDISKTAEILGFRPEVDLAKGLSDVDRWFRAQGRERVAGAKVFSDSE